jgi:hypothetical protein
MGGCLFLRIRRASIEGDRSGHLAAPELFSSFVLDPGWPRGNAPPSNGSKLDNENEDGGC